jgi:hypothetical protein
MRNSNYILRFLLTLSFLFNTGIDLFCQKALVGRGGGGVTRTAVSASLERQSKRDAYRLALRLDAEKEDARYLPVVIAKEHVNGLFKALLNLYSADETAKSISRCNIHTFPNLSIDHLVIIYKRNAEWAGPLRQGVNETTSKELNSILDRNDLVIEKHVQWNDTQDAITIRSKEPLNMAALAAQFEAIVGVVQIDLGLPKVGGNDIRAKRITGGYEIDFVLIFGAGASKQEHGWKYKVMDTGSVVFVKESGDAVPAWMRCEGVKVTHNF